MPGEQCEAGSTSNIGGLRVSPPQKNLLCGLQRACPAAPFPVQAASLSAVNKDEKGGTWGILGSIMAVPLSNSFSSV